MLKKALIVACVFTGFFIAVSSGLAANTSRIDDLRTKALNAPRTLTDSEVQVIDDFIADSFDEMLNSITLGEILAIKNEIARRKGPSKSTGYSVAFNKALKKHLTAVAAEIIQLEAGVMKNQIQVNLIILAAETKSYDLADFAITMIDNENVVVRYWAVKCIANKTVITQFTAESGSHLNNAVIQAFDKLAETESHPEILDLLAYFASQSTDSQIEDILIKVADKRIKGYVDWTVKNELIDSRILDKLADKMVASKSSATNARWSARFAQLYSYLIQRYVTGASVISQSSLSNLKSAIVETENRSFAKLLGRTQLEMKKALEKKDNDQLLKQHDSFLGSASRQGRLATEFKFDYGKNASGQPITAPKKLTPPPALKK